MKRIKKNHTGASRAPAATATAGAGAVSLLCHCAGDCSCVSGLVVSSTRPTTCQDGRGDGCGAGRGAEWLR